MTAIAPSFYPAVPSLLHDTQRAFAAAQQQRTGTINRLQALRNLSDIEERTPNPRLRRLCEHLAYAMFPEVPKPQPPIVEVYAR